MSGPDPALATFERRANFDSSHPENDPSHPRYELPHLRHQPGDTWEIGGKPYDPEDRGPYGNPLWRPDARTGRHRRGELPDPLPPEPEPSPPVGDRPSPEPRRQGFWTEPEQHHQEHRFDRLRENAWDDFMTDSAPLAAAHHQAQPRRRTALDREAGLALAMWIRLARWLFAVIRSFAARPEPDPVSAPAHTRQTRPHPADNRPAPGHTRRSYAAVRTAGMAQAIAGAQRARAGVASWA